MVERADPIALQPQHFRSAKPGQKHHSDGGKTGGMFSLGGKGPHDIAEIPKFIIAQSPLTAFDGELSNALCRVLADDLEPGRVAEKAAERSNGTARNS